MYKFIAPLFVLPLLAGVETVTPAQQGIALAESIVRKDPKQADAHLDLARALVKRARETGGAKYLDQADRALDEALKLEPSSFEGQKIRVMAMLARHEYRPALELARKLNKLTPDDVPVYGLVSEACMALGEYKEAEESAQWMLDLRRNNLGGMLRGAFLRELFGDIDGALEWLTSVFRLTSASETEERAWLLTHIARLNLSAGKLDAADRQAGQALGIFPDYHFALRLQADVKTAQQKHAEAVALLRRVTAISKHPKHQYALALALGRVGEEAESKKVFAGFEKSARAMESKPDNANRELVFYYADVALKPEEALRVARAESERRRDVYTLDALAWALHKSGRGDEARVEMKKALEPGIRDAEIRKHAEIVK